METPLISGKNIVGFMTLVVFLLVVLLAVWGTRTKSIADSQKLGTPKVILADGGSPLSGVVYTALEEGLFLAQGVDVRLSPYLSGRDALAALVHDEADLATVAETSIAKAQIGGTKGHNKFAIIATLSTSERSCAILAIGRIKQPKDLIGAKVGFVPGTSAEYFLREFLIKYHIENKDITWIPLEPEESTKALVNGEVSAISTFDPHIANIRMTHNKDITLFMAPDIYNFTWNLVASERITKSPGLIKQVLEALISAENYVSEEADKAKSITARYLRLNTFEMDTIWPNMNFNLHLSQSLVISLERQMSMILGVENQGRPLPNVMDYIYFDGLRDLLAERVTLIR